MKDLEKQLVKRVTDADGNAEMLREACNCLPVSRQTLCREHCQLSDDFRRKRV